MNVMFPTIAVVSVNGSELKMRLSGRLSIGVWSNGLQLPNKLLPPMVGVGLRESNENAYLRLASIGVVCRPYWPFRKSLRGVACGHEGSVVQ